MNDTMHPVATFITMLLQKPDDWQLHILQHWRMIVGDLHTKIRVEKIDRETLIIGVYDVHWMHEVYLLAQPLLQKINKALDKPHVKKLHFTLVKSYPETKKIHKYVQYQKHYAVSPAEQKVLNTFDAEMQDVLKKFLIRCKQHD